MKMYALFGGVIPMLVLMQSRDNTFPTFFKHYDKELLFWFKYQTKHTRMVNRCCFMRI